MSQLPKHPELYSEGREPGTQELVAHPNYIVVYSIAQAAIEVVTVVHSQQQYPR